MFAPARVPGTSCYRMHPARVLDASRIWQKGHGSYVSLAATLSQGFVLERMHLVHIPDASCARP